MRHFVGSSITRRPYDPEGVKQARALRRNATAAEKVVWDLLRGRRMLGLKFRRQQPVAGFVLDFYCSQARIGIELDGSVHESPDAQRWDAGRDAALARHGIAVIRIKNEAISRPALVSLLEAALLPSPAGRGVGGEGQTQRGRG